MQHAPAAAAGDHRPHRGLRRQQRGAQVEVEDPVPLGLGVVLGRVQRAAGAAADGVDDHVDAAERLRPPRSTPVGVGLARHVGGDGDARRRRPPRAPPRAAASRPMDDDPRADAGERRAQPRRRCRRSRRHDGDAVVEPEARELVASAAPAPEEHEQRARPAATGATRLSTASRLASPRSSTSSVCRGGARRRRGLGGVAGRAGRRLGRRAPAAGRGRRRGRGRRPRRPSARRGSRRSGPSAWR